MKINSNKYKVALLGVFALLVSSCGTEEYSLGDLTTPTNLVINTKIVGQNDANPYGDGSAEVIISATADNAISYVIAYNLVSDFGTPEKQTLTGEISKKFTLPLGENTYRITVVAYGKGGASTTAIKDITVKSVYNPDPSIIANLTNGSSKTWSVDKSVPGHFGVGPWTETYTPSWWSAGINEKVDCCNCFYTAKFTFSKVTSNNTYSLNVQTPDGAFSKGGDLTTLPGLGSNGETCYNYGGGTSEFFFVESTTNTPEESTTGTSIVLAGVNTFIGYGSLQKEYEILEITNNSMYLRVQGTETGNAWYLKLVPNP